jgi:RNA polymerase-interacting CarD/CdnL/TRCF family regulator
METQTPDTQAAETEARAEAKPAIDPVTGEFLPGAIVVYGLHGKCTVTAIEPRTVGGQEIRFYRLDLLKSALSRSTRQEPSIFIPVAHAPTKGLRLPIDKARADAIFQILGNREYYFTVNEAWHSVLPKLELALRTDGAEGLAKVYSYLIALKKKHLVLPSEIGKFNENVTRVLVRELSEATGEPPRNIEERLARFARQKLSPDS